MEDEEETLVLNYPVEDFATPPETNNGEPQPVPKLDGSLDENQNAKVDVKVETVSTTPQKTPKNLKVVSEKRALRSTKSQLSTASNTQNNANNCDSTTPNSKKRKRGGSVLGPKKIHAKECNGTKVTKVNGLKSPFTQKAKEHPTSKDPNKSTSDVAAVASNNVTDVVIKVENVEEDDVIVATPVVNSNVNARREPQDFDIKDEAGQQIHTEFKYESLSETEENIRKKRQSVTDNAKRNNLKTLKKLDTLFKVCDLKLKCNLPIFKCDHCLYIGNSRANLERHTLLHMDPNDILWYKCTDCEYKSKYEHQLKSHTLIHKNPNEILFFQCPHCELKCSRKHNLAHHIKTIHSNRVNSFRCANCEYSTFSKDRLVAHLKKHSSEVFTCTLCKFVTKRKSYLESHFKLKHTEVDRPFPCDTCSYKGKTKRELDRHYDRMHNKEKLHEYKCNNCDFTSIYKKNLEFHLLHMHQNSEGFQKYICGHCNKEFAYKNGLKTHIVRIHLKFTEDDWHKCQECKYKCKDVNTLKRHIRRNHGAPRLTCKKCCFATNRQKSMIAHMKTHEVDSGVILKCPECPYRIIQVVSFTYHMKVLHGRPVGAKDIHRYYLKVG